MFDMRLKKYAKKISFFSTKRKARVMLASIVVGGLLTLIATWQLYRFPVQVEAANITISGTVYDPDVFAYDCSADNLNIVVKINGAGSFTTTCVNADGTYSISGVSVNGSDVITVFIDNAVFHGAFVSRAASSPISMTVDLVQDKLTLDHADAGPLTTANLDAYDRDNNANIDFQVTGSNVTFQTPYTSINTNATFTPAGTVTASTLELLDGADITLGTTGNSLNSLTVASGAVATINSDTTMNGSYVTLGGTVTTTSGTPTVTFGSNSTATNHGTSTYYNLSFSAATAYYLSGTAAVTANNNLSISTGATLNQSISLTVTGSLTTTGTGIFQYTAGLTPTTTVAGTTIGGGSGKVSFYNLTKTGSGTTTWAGSGLNFVQNLVTVSAGTLSSGNSLYAGNITESGGTFTQTSGSLYIISPTNKTLTATGSISNAVLNDGLVGYWNFDETAGTSATDGSGYGHTGTHVNTPTIDSDVPTVNFTNNRSLLFNGSSQYVDLSNPSFLNTQFDDKITLSAWIKPTTAVGFHNIVGKSDNANHDSPYYVWSLSQSGDVLTCRIDNTTVSSAASTIVASTWQHVACVYDGANITIYKNGVSVGTTAKTGNITSSTRNVRIAGRDTTSLSEYFGGRVDDVRIYRRGLSGTEIANLDVGESYVTGGATYTLGGALNITGNLTLPSGTLDVSGSNFGVGVGGNWNSAGGVFTPQAGTVTLNGTASGKTITSYNQHFNNLTVSGSGGVWTLADRLWVDGTLAISNGTLDVSANNYVVHAGTLNQTGGTFTPRSGSLVLDAQSAQAVALSSSLNILRIEDASETNLAGYWKLDSGTGSVARDRSGNSRNGTLTNNPFWTTSLNSTTTFDNATGLDFDGSNDYVTMGNVINVNNTADLSISGWFNRDTFTTDDVIVAKRNGNTAGDIGYIVWIDASTDKLRMEFSDGTNEYELASVSTFTTTDWHHFAVTWDENLAGGTKMYIDGVDNSATTSGTIGNVGDTTSSATLRIGAESDAGAPFDGKIDDVRIYTTPLSATQAANLGAGRYANGDQGTATFTLSGTGTVATLAIDSGVLNGGTSGLTVTNAFSLLDGQGAYVGGSATQTFSSTMTIAASSLTLGGTIVVAGNFSQTGGTVLGTSGGTLSVGGNITLNAGATFTAGTSTVAMTGASKTIDSAGKSLYGFSVSGTDSPTASDLTVTGPVDISDSGTLTIGSGRTLTHSGSSFTLNSTGTITGIGTLTFISGSSGPGTGGTISIITRFDATSGDIASTTFDARTYGGIVEPYNNSATNRTITFASGTYTLSGSSSSFNPNAAAGGDLTLEGATNNPTVTIGGNLDFTGAGSGTEVLAMGDGTWTVSGNMDLTDGFASPRVASLNPTWDNFATLEETYDGACALFSTVNSCGTSSSTTMTVGNDLLSGGGQTCPGVDTYYQGYMKYDLSSISNTNTVTQVTQQLYANSVGTVGPVVYRSSTDTPNAQACNALYSTPGTTYNSFNTWATGSNLADLTFSAKSDVQSKLGNAAYAVVLSGGSDMSGINSTDASADKPVLRVGYFATSTSPTVIMNGASKTLTSGSGRVATFYNLTLSGSITVNSASTVYVYNTFDLSGTVTNNTAALAMAGTTGTIIGGGNTIGNMSIFDGNTTTLSTSDLTIASAIAVYPTGTLTIGAGRTLTHTASSLTLNGTINGSGLLTFTSTSSGPSAAGTLSVPVRFDATGGNIASTTFDARTYGGAVEFYSSSAIARTATLAASTYTLSGASSNLILTAAGTANMTFDAQTNNAILSIAGGIDFQGVGAGTEIITTGTGAWSVGGNIDLTAGTLTATSGNTLTMTGTSATLVGAGQSFYNLTINPSSAGTVTAQTSNVSVANALAVAASDTFTIDTGVTVTVTGITTISGTIDGAGTLYVYNTVGTTGTLGSNVYFDASSGSYSIPTRTFTGSTRTVTIYTDTSAVTLGSAAGTLSIAGSLVLDDAASSLTFSADTNNPTVTIGENFSTAVGSDIILVMGSGTWTIGGNANFTGIGGVTAGTSTLVMNGTSKTLTSNNDTFYNFTVSGGSISMLDAATISNNVAISSGTLTSTSGTLTIGGSFDNNGTFVHNSGTILFNAGTTGKTVECGSSTLNAVTFNNASGGWTIQTDNCSTAGAVTLTAANTFVLESGRTLTVGGAFTNSLTGSATTWTGSTLYLTGSSAAASINTKASSGDTYATLQIGAAQHAIMWNSDASTITVDAGGSLLSQNHAGTSGRLNIYGSVNSRTNEYWSYATDFDGTVLGSPRQADIRLAPDATVTVDAGDSLAVIGQSPTANRTQITRLSTGGFNMTVNGAIDIENTDISYQNASGVNISSTGSVTALSNVAFDNAAVANTSYITVSGITATQTFSGIVFDRATSGIDTNATHNVTATGSGIVWTFAQATGYRAGSTYESENSGATINWDSPTITVNDGTSTDADYTTSTSQLSANWSITSTTGVTSFAYAIGATAGGTNVVDVTDVGAAYVITKTGLSLTHGQTYYITIYARNIDSEVVAQKTTDGITVDASAPLISSLTVVATSTSALVTWTTNEAATTQVQYGTTTSYGTSSTADNTLTTTHSVTVSGLTAGTTYHLQAMSNDAAGNTSLSADVAFSSTNNSSAAPTTTLAAPTISNLVDGSVIGDRKPLIAGTGPALGAVFIVVDRVLVRTTPVNAEGYYMVDLKNNLSYGTHQIVVRGKTVDKEVSVESTPITITIVKPTTAVTVQKVIITNTRPSATFYVVAPAHAYVQLLLDGSVFKTYDLRTKTKAFGFIAKIEIPSNLTEGQHRFSFVNTNLSGRPSIQTGITKFTIRPAPPTAETVQYPNPLKYLVHAGDSAWSIALRITGNSKNWPLIVQANIKQFPSLRLHPNIIQIGWVLDIPAR